MADKSPYGRLVSSYVGQIGEVVNNLANKAHDEEIGAADHYAAAMEAMGWVLSMTMVGACQQLGQSLDEGRDKLVDMIQGMFANQPLLGAAVAVSTTPIGEEGADARGKPH